MRYVQARYADDQDELAYRIYLTDELYYSDRGMSHSLTYKELVGLSADRADADDRSGDEIVEDVIKNAGLVVR